LNPDWEAGGNNAAASQAFPQIPVSAEASHFPGEHQPVILSPNPPLSLWSHPKFQQNEGAKDRASGSLMMNRNRKKWSHV
jgi:hypothetical protein